MVRKINKTFWENRKVLLTGHTGFKGSWLLSWLIKLGAEVKGVALEPKDNLSLFTQIKKEIDGKFINSYTNILDKKVLKSEIDDFSPDIIFHLAAQPLVIESYKEPLLTWETNVMGSLNILESVKHFKHKCGVVLITTDKVYKNKEWAYGYRENDELGGHDPYSASKAACEIAISSWRNSFVGTLSHQNKNLRISTARAGNVIGGGDWSTDRILPDSIRSLIAKEKIQIRNPSSRRPWQHVLEPLLGYLFLAEDIYSKGDQYCGEFNFGPYIESNKTVKELVEEIISIWPGEWNKQIQNNAPHEANLLYLQIEKAQQILNWEPKWDFKQTVKYTVEWYQAIYKGENPYKMIQNNINEYISI